MTSADSTDEELMVAYQEGSNPAFQELFTRHSARVYTYFGKRISSKEQAQDLTQEVFLKLHHSRESYLEKFSFLPWLYTITANTFKDYCRREKRRNLLSVEIQNQVKVEEQGSLSDFSSNSGELQKAFSNLNEIQKSAIEMRYSENLQFEEIANRLNTSAENVRQLISRGVRRIKMKIKGDPS